MAVAAAAVAPSQAVLLRVWFLRLSQAATQIIPRTAQNGGA